MLNPRRRLERCLRLYRRGASSWASAVQVSRRPPRDLLPRPISGGIDLEQRLRLEAAEVSPEIKPTATGCTQTINEARAGDDPTLDTGDSRPHPSVPIANEGAAS